jgi:hypothetical protein
MIISISSEKTNWIKYVLFFLFWRHEDAIIDDKNGIICRTLLTWNNGSNENKIFDFVA